METKPDAVLGKAVEYHTQYNPSVLVGMDRDDNRVDYSITNGLFQGYDAWHLYEVSFLLNNGMPIALTGKLVYPSNSPRIVESKSLKLYLYSLNNEKMGDTPEEAITKVKDIIQKDLKPVIGTDVELQLFDFNLTEVPLDIYYPDLSHFVDISKFLALSYTENTDLIRVKPGKTGCNFSTPLLRSNCKVTHQPDWGDLYVAYRADVTLHLPSFLQYVVSLRNENHFHEEICEMVFKALIDKLGSNAFLMVGARYTRRGGIDICPIRYNALVMDVNNWCDANVWTVKNFRQ